MKYGLHSSAGLLQEAYQTIFYLLNLIECAWVFISLHLRIRLTASYSNSTMSTVETSFRWNTPGQVIAAAVVLPTLGIVAVLLRFRVRHVQKTGIGLDDWLILPAMVSDPFEMLRPCQSNITTSQLLVIGLGVSLLYGRLAFSDSDLPLIILPGVAKHALAYPTPTNTSPSPESQLYQFSAVQELQEKVS